ncbi:MAG: choice-of-anchor tandem repeat GloVer-containing protein [Terriglobales bacterium]
MTSLTKWKKVRVVLVLGAATAISAHAQTFNTLVDFEASDGAYPGAGLIQGRDGDLYGTTSDYGMYAAGTVFKITREGALTTLYNFCGQVFCPDGAYPIGGLVLGTDGNFYGTTIGGGSEVCFEDGFPCGTVFRISPAGALTTLYTFDGTNGDAPFAGLIQAKDGNFYGTTYDGGAYGGGTVFKITREGNLTTLYSFCSQPKCADGYVLKGGVVQGVDGNFYGTTEFGGTGATCLLDYYYGCGTVFKLTPEGTLTTLHSFCVQQTPGNPLEAICPDGGEPYAGLARAIDGSFYGTTVGTVFRIAHEGKLTTLYTFCLTQANCGVEPQGALIQATDGNFYGTTFFGGVTTGCASGGCGTVFKITPHGTLTILHDFDNTDGANPASGLLQATSGNLYSTTYWGGSSSECGPDGCGTVFRLATGLGPSVAFVQAAGKVGQTAQILGKGFTGTTGVSFNGTPASFTVVSDTFEKATVPAGATTGYVTVTTPSRTLTSNVPFRVLKEYRGATDRGMK